MVLDFNLKEGEGEKKNKIGDKKVESLKEKEIEKEVKYIYGKIIILHKDPTPKHLNLQNPKSPYPYLPQPFQKLKNHIHNKNKTTSISPTPLPPNYKNTPHSFYSQLLNSYPQLLTPNIITPLFQHLKPKNLNPLPKKLPKIPIKPNLPPIPPTILSNHLQSNLKYPLLYILFIPIPLFTFTLPTLNNPKTSPILPLIPHPIPTFVCNFS